MKETLREDNPPVSNVRTEGRRPKTLSQDRVGARERMDVQDAEEGRNTGVRVSINVV